jgi:probable phosphoglycerate mutase
VADVPGSEIWLVRHGETEWSRDHRHTSRTDVALTRTGEAAAKSLRDRLARESFDEVVSSPRQRARRTAGLAGFGTPELLDDLVEWDYGAYEGRTTAEIREQVPGWSVWTHPSPGGESAEQVAQRLDRALGRLRDGGRVLVFGHGHALRGLTARWLGLPVGDGRLFRLDTATVSVLGYERETPVILRWNS